MSKNNFKNSADKSKFSNFNFYNSTVAPYTLLVKPCVPYQ